MYHIKTKGQEGERYAESEVVGNIVAGKKSTLADDGVAVTALDVTTGLVIVEDLTNEDGAILTVINDGGTPTIAKSAGSAAITVTKDTDAKVNVYVEDGVIKAQNTTGGEIELVIKSYL